MACSTYLNHNTGTPHVVDNEVVLLNIKEVTQCQLRANDFPFSPETEAEFGV